MVESIKKEFQLEGLNCENCLLNIENEANQIDSVRANIDRDTKTLTLEVEHINQIDLILSKVNSILSGHRHHIPIKEKTIVKTPDKNLVVAKLGCANCALKMEKQIKNINGVKNASIDFATKKLKIEANNIDDYSNIVAQARRVVKRIEPNARIIDKDEDRSHTHNSTIEQTSFKREIIALVASAILLAVGLFVNLPPLYQLGVFIISYLIAGGKVILKAIKNISKGQVFDENFLMTIATIGAFGVKEYAEGIAVMLFYRVGELFQDIAVNKSRKSISSLMDIRPDYANLKVGDNISKVSPSDVKIGDIIIVKPGEKVPLDGVIIDGNSYLDTSALTGESVLRKLKVDNEVLSGFINTSGLITIKVTKNFSESTVSKILDLVENASSKKAPTENFITKFARYYTPVVVITALLIALIPPLLIPGATFDKYVYTALIFLVISCPCALVISIPLGFFGGIGASSRSGILVKGSNFLEGLNSLETVVFDKTGTLTEGVFKVTEINANKNYSKDELLMFAAYAESYSLHPIARSIINEYSKDINKNKIETYEEISGHGVKVIYEGKTILVGNSKLMKSENIKYLNTTTFGTVIHIAINSVYAGNIVISDIIKKDSKNAIQELKALGIKKTIMLTGDSETVATAVGESLGIDEVYFELLPDQKVERLEYFDKLKSPNGKIAFVGDGINDAPTLARSDIGIAMGALGSDAAIEAADIVIMTDEPSKIAKAVRIAKRTRKIVYQNIVFALGTKVLFLVLGSLGLVSLWSAVFADVGVSLLAVLNAMRVLKYKNI